MAGRPDRTQDEGAAERPSAPERGGDLAGARETLARAGVTVLLEDNHVLVVSKPAGLLSQAGPQDAAALPEILDAYRRAAEGKAGHAFVGLVHRLDRNVSGVMVVAKTTKAASRISRALRTRDPRLVKVYLAWVAGRFAEAEGTLESRLARAGGVSREAPEGRDARLDYRVEASGRGASRLRIELHTGVSHQIRAQLAASDHPLVGDRKYGGPEGPRPALHALRLVFPHPVQGTLVDAVAAVPDDLLLVDQTLRMEPPLAPWWGR